MLIFDSYWNIVRRRETAKKVRRLIAGGYVAPDAPAYRLWADGTNATAVYSASGWEKCLEGRPEVCEWYVTYPRHGRWTRRPSRMNWEAARDGRVDDSNIEAGWRTAENGEAAEVEGWHASAGGTYNSNSVGRYMADQLPTLIKPEALAALRQAGVIPC